MWFYRASTTLFRPEPYANFNTNMLVFEVITVHIKIAVQGIICSEIIYPSIFFHFVRGGVAVTAI